MRANRAKSKRRAVGYVRMSSEMQKSSPRQQRDQIKKLAQRRGYEIVRWYEDLAVSGDDIRRRVAFRRMVADAERKSFETILCWSQDRFGRFDSIEAGEWIGPLRRAGIELVTVTDGEITWNDAIGRLIYTIQQEAKHAFLVDLARGILRGAHQRALEGRLHVGKIPYGYNKLIFDERGELVRRLAPLQKLSKPKEWTGSLVPTLDSSIIRTVRWRFRSYDRGMSIRGLAVSLNRRRVPSPEGHHWSSDTIRKILANPVYVGDRVWNRRHVGKYAGLLGGEIVLEAAFTKKFGYRTRGRIANDRSDWVVVKNVHPALVERAQFDRVQARLRQQRRRKPSPVIDPLKSLVVCGHCGTTLNVNHHRNIRKDKVVYYRRLECPTYHTKGRTVCRPRSISQPILQRLIVDLLTERVLDRDLESRLRMQPIDTLEEIQAFAGTDLPFGKPAKINTEQGASEKLVAEVMGQAARFRVALCGGDIDLLCIAIRGLVKRIDVWFARHPTMPGASKISTGKVHLRPPFTDCVTGSSEICFDRAEFDLAASKIPARMRNANWKPTK